jgi:excisionase family DNA binding protein
MLSVHDAAQRLGVSDRRVRALIDSGRLRAQRVGRAWIIESNALAALDGVRPPGRPLSESAAWTELLDQSGSARVLAGASSRYRNRSTRVELDGPDLAAIVKDKAAREGGWAAACEIDPELDSDTTKPIVVYVGAGAFDKWKKRHWLIGSMSGRVVAQIVSNEIAEALHAQSSHFVPNRVVAVDLSDLGGPRVMAAARRIWNR